MKLICIPYAGGSQNSFQHWPKNWGSGISIFPVELPGRGAKVREPLCRTMQDAVQSLFRDIEPTLDQGRYAIFGHSLGAALAYRLLQKIRRRKLPMPSHVFFSASRPLHFRKANRLHLLPDDEFISQLKSYGGTPLEILKSKELLTFFLPIIRSDFQLLHLDCLNRDEIETFDIDFSVFWSRDDEMSDEDANKWSQYTNGRTKTYHFEGGHFFIHPHQEMILKIIDNTLRAYL